MTLTHNAMDLTIQRHPLPPLVPVPLGILKLIQLRRLYTWTPHICSNLLIEKHVCGRLASYKNVFSFVCVCVLGSRTKLVHASNRFECEKVITRQILPYIDTYILK